MSGQNLELSLKLKIAQTGLENIQNLIGEIKAAGGETTEFEAQAAALNAEISKLNQQQALIDQFKQIKAAVGDSATALKQAKSNTAEMAIALKSAEQNSAGWRKALKDAATDEQATSQQIKELSRALTQSEKDVKQQTAAFERARTVTRNTEKIYQDQRLALQSLRQQMAESGVATTSLSEKQTRINQSTRALSQAQEALTDSLKTEYVALTNTAEAAKQAADANENSTKSYTKTAQGVRSISDQLAEARRGLLAFLGAQSAITAAGNLAKLADDYKSLEARIKLAIGDHGNLDDAMAAVSETALTTGQNIQTVGELYASLGRSTQSELSEITALTDTIAKATVLSGGSAASADAAIIQLNQSLASGVFRGDEFNSVMEQAPVIGDAIAKSLGVTRGELRAMAADGKLTADVVTKALLDQKQAIDDSFAKLPLTIARATENVKTHFTLMLGEFDKTHQASATVANAIEGIANNLDAIASIATTAGVAMAAGFAAKTVPAVMKVATELVSATVKAGGLRAALAAMPTSLVVTIAVAGADLAINQVLKFAEANSEAQKNLDALNQKQHSAQLQHRADLQATLAALAQYKDTTQATAAEFAAMSDAEKQDYQYKIDAARRYNVTVLNLAYAQQQLGEQVTANAKDAHQALDDLKTGQDALNNRISIGAQKLIDQFNAAKTQGAETKKTLEDMAKAVDIGSGGSIQAFGETLRKLGEEGKISAADVRGSWAAVVHDLNNADLARFNENSAIAFNGFARDAKAAGDAAQAALDEAANRAGVDVKTAMGQVTQGITDALGNIDNLKTGLLATGNTARDIAPVMEQALGKAIDTAKTQSDIDALKRKLASLQQQQVLNADAAGRLSDQMDAQRLKIEQTIPGIQSLDEAFANLGITSEKVLQKQASDAKAAYDAIRGGNSTLSEQQAAFEAYAQIAVKANGGVADAALYAQAAQVGMADALKQSQVAAINAQPGVKALADEYKRAADSASANTQAVQDYGNAQIAAAQTALDLARSQNDEVAAARAGLQLADAKIAASQNMAAAKQQEADAASAYVAELRAQLAADGELTAADEAVIAQAQKVARAKQLEADTASQAADAEQKKAEATQQSSKATLAGIPALSGYQEAVTGQIAAVGKYNQSLAENINLAIRQGQSWYGLTRAIKELDAAAGNGPIDKLKADLQSANTDILQAEKDMRQLGSAAQITAYEGFGAVLNAIASQKKAAAEAAAENLRYQLALAGIKAASDAGTLSLAEQRDQLVALSHKYRDLDAATLSQLQAQIDAVNNKLKDMQDQADATLRSLQEELANQQGNYADAARIEGQQKLLNLQQQLDTAKAAGNAAAVASLKESLAIQTKLNDAALAEAKAKEQQAKVDAAAAQQASALANPVQNTTAAAPAPTDTQPQAAPVPAASTVQTTTLAPNIYIQGLLDVNDNATLDSLARKLQPVFSDLTRRGVK